MPTPLRLAPFLFALLCFLLPFAEVSCDGKSQELGKMAVVKVTGWEILTGNKQDPERPQRSQSHEPNYLLLTTAALLVLGLLAAASPASRRFGSLCAIGAGGCLMYLSYHLKDAILTQDNQLDQVTNFLAPNASKPSEPNLLGNLSHDLLGKALVITPEPGLFAAAACALLAAILCALPSPAARA